MHRWEFKTDLDLIQTKFILKDCLRLQLGVPGGYFYGPTYKWFPVDKVRGVELVGVPRDVVPHDLALGVVDVVRECGI